MIQQADIFCSKQHGLLYRTGLIKQKNYNNNDETKTMNQKGNRVQGRQKKDVELV